MKFGKPDFSFTSEIRFCAFGKRNLNLFTFSFLSGKLHKNYQMAGKINSNICLMLSVYKSHRHMVKYGRQRNHILQDLTELEMQIPMKASKTENRFETGFQQPKSGLQK